MKKPFYFDPSAKGTAVFLGPTEAKLMDLVWNEKSLTVKMALYYLGAKKEPAYTTVMTVLRRLADKGLLRKKKEGRGFIYTPAVDKSTFLKQRVKLISDCLKHNFKDLR